MSLSNKEDFQKCGLLSFFGNRLMNDKRMSSEVCRVSVGGVDARIVQEKISRDMVGALQVTIDVTYVTVTDVDSRMHAGEFPEITPNSNYVPGIVWMEAGGCRAARKRNANWESLLF